MVAIKNEWLLAELEKQTSQMILQAAKQGEGKKQVARTVAREQFEKFFADSGSDMAADGSKVARRILF